MSEPRFLCDEMLQRLGRWLRAAGYDTLIATPGSEDHALAARANAAKRWLITRDRQLARFRNGGGRIVLLYANETAELAAELTSRFRIDWLHRPFTRCLNCNTPLLPATPEQWAKVPESALARSTDAWYCPTCDKVFWVGSHVRRMRHTLENFTQGVWEIASD
jgi:hypothetical protein